MAGPSEKTVEIPPNVMRVLNSCSQEIGKKAADNFSQDVYTDILELKIESPIEQLLFVALRTVQELNGLDHDDPEKIEGQWVSIGLGIYPQHQVEKYRVDFMIHYGKRLHNQQEKIYSKSLLVECDSQQFHERTEAERRYEKERDRFLTSKGWRVFHYTGTQIIENPLQIAKEIIADVTGMNPEWVETDATY